VKVPAATGSAGATDRRTAGLSARQRRSVQDALLAWYRTAARPLRIRTTREPWPVLVAEVMAQQTQIARVELSWTAFLERFPTPSTLADATPADVLRAWAGLGYNRRALNLQRAARAIVVDHAGRVPDSVEALERLPGVGPYTARAVAALAYGRPVAAVDTNVRRVLGRLVGQPMTARQLQAMADGLVAREDPATWTHASMELGATVCRASRPLCGTCPLERWCATGGQAPGSTSRTAPTDATPRTAAGDPSLRTAAGDPSLRTAAASPPFEETTRWLRGRIVACLREVEDASWIRLPETLGSHGPERIAAAADAMRREGLIEQRADGSVRLPSSPS
jgi:A/G-specific adenine glycosylase